MMGAAVRTTQRTMPALIQRNNLDMISTGPADLSRLFLNGANGHLVIPLGREGRLMQGSSVESILTHFQQ
jgi:hypothetical protein